MKYDENMNNENINYKNEKILDAFTKSLIIQASHKDLNIDLTKRIMSKIELEAKSKHLFEYTPLISKFYWIVIAFVLLFISVISYFNSEVSNLNSNTGIYQIIELISNNINSLNTYLIFGIEQSILVNLYYIFSILFVTVLLIYIDNAINSFKLFQRFLKSRKNQVSTF